MVDSVWTMLVGFMLGFIVLLVAIGDVMIDKRKAAEKSAQDAEEKTRQAEENVERLEAKLTEYRSPGHDHVQRVKWRGQKLMNASEFRVFLELHSIVARSTSHHRLFTQVCYAEFLKAVAPEGAAQSRRAAELAMSRKRADFLIIDKGGYPVAVLEYQGDGHYRGNAHDRDQAKRVACHAAGIPFIEVPAGGLTTGQRIDLEQHLGLRPRLAAE